MRKLKRQPKPGRAAVVVPNGTHSAMASARGLKKSCSKTLTFIRLFVCPTGSSLRTRVSRLMSFSSTGPIRRKRSGTTSSLFRKDGKITPRLSHSSSKNSPIAWSGGMVRPAHHRTGRRTNAPGKCRPPNCLPTAVISIARTQTQRPTSNISRLNSLPMTFLKKISASRK